MVHTKDTLFDAVEFQKIYHETPLCFMTHILCLYHNMCSSFPYNTWENNRRKCDTEGFVPVKSLYGVFGSPYF